jgi:hypothetical protein
MPNPWDILPTRPRGDADAKVLFAAIGEALTSWEWVEGACAEVFAVLVSVSHKSSVHAPAIRAFGTVISFPGRCEMIREAAEAYFLRRRIKSARYQKRLKELMKECLQFSGRRNEIAHGRVSEVYTMRRGKKFVLGNYLLPSLYNPRKYNLGSAVTYQYTSQEVIHFRQQFTELSMKVGRLSRDLAGPS